MVICAFCKEKDIEDMDYKDHLEIHKLISEITLVNMRTNLVKKSKKKRVKK